MPGNLGGQPELVITRAAASVAAHKLSNMQKSSTSRTSLLNRTQIIRVRFPADASPGDETDFIFGSLAAVFDMFSEAELGVSLRALYALGLAVDGATHTTPLGVQIKKMTAYRKRQKNS